MITALLDAPDIDHIIRNLTIPEIKSKIRLADFMLQGNPSEEIELGWREYKAKYELAFDIAQSYDYNLVITPPKGNEGYLYLRIQTLQRKIGETYYTLQEHLKDHWDKKKGGKPKTYDTI